MGIRPTGLFNVGQTETIIHPHDSQIVYFIYFIESYEHAIFQGISIIFRLMNTILFNDFSTFIYKILA